MTSDKLNHLGIIMDGNRRWAKSKNLPTTEGHRQGYKTLKKIIEEVNKHDIKHLSIYAFSNENWNRSKDEVNNLMKFFKLVLKNELNDIASKGVVVQFLGSSEQMPKDVLKLINELEAKSISGEKGYLNICLNYGGHKEIVDAVNKLQKAHIKVTEKSITKTLYHPNIPPLDLVIRTSGEQRLSNFMLWRSVYSELSFTDTLWPDFTPKELKEIIENYNSRDRRFGK